MKTRTLLLIFLLFYSNVLLAKNEELIGTVLLVGMNMDYKEYSASSGALLDSEESNFANIGGAEMNLAYRYDTDISSYNQFAANLMIIGGETTYKGSLLHSGNPYGSLVSKTQNVIVDFDVSFEGANMLSKKFWLNYGIGLGYRSWERSLSVSQVETYTWYSFRPMIGAKFIVNPKIDIGLSMEYQFGLNPKMSETTQNLNFDLGGADIFEVSLPITYKYDDKMNMLFEYTYQKQSIERSNYIYSGGYWYYEPESTSFNQYLKLGIVFKF